MRQDTYIYRTQIRPKLIERLIFVACKLTLELLAATLVLTLWTPQDLAGVKTDLSLPDALVLVLIYGFVFAYIPMAVLFALLWGLTPRTWRPMFPALSLALGLLHLSMGFVMAGAPWAIAPSLIAMAASGLLVFLIYKMSIVDTPDP
ncbi:MAG: hypothetical protein QNJ20_09845 [Paracoccaceae bacterium]|nr:hypothetical protein [Paracoccaceae bacterium]